MPKNCPTCGYDLQRPETYWYPHVKDYDDNEYECNNIFCPENEVNVND